MAFWRGVIRRNVSPTFFPKYISAFFSAASASAFLSHLFLDSRSPSQMASSSSSPRPIRRLFCWDPLGAVCEEVDGVEVAMRQGEVDIDEAAGV